MDRPTDLGEAYFYFRNKVVDIKPYRNHRDWLIDHGKELDLPDYVFTKSSKALFESYKLGFIRIVWDKGGSWQQGATTNIDHEKALYINGIDDIVWANMRGIMNSEIWAGNIDLLVIEYLDIVDGKPKWNRDEIFKIRDLGPLKFDELYRGRQPKRSLAPAGAIWGGDDLPKSFILNKQRNIDNDK